MSATAIRSGELLALLAAPRRGAPVPSASAVAFRMWGLVAGRVSARVVAAAAEGTGSEAEAEGKTKPKKKRAASGIMKPKPISPELREFVGGAAELPRTEALKIIWAHIKGNNLQEIDPVVHGLSDNEFVEGINFFCVEKHGIPSFITGMKLVNKTCRNITDPENKKIIVCDEKLKKIFGGRDRVGFLEISGLLNPHFQK